MKKLLLLLTLLFNFLTHAQSLVDEESYYTPNGLLENVFDNYGNHFLLKDVLIAPKISVKDSTKILNSQLLCTSGIFEIYFEKGSGMDLQNNPNHIERRNVVCTVFNELSNFLDTPLKNSGNSTKIKIWIRDIDEIPNAQNFDISHGTSYYNVPKNSNTADISDNQLWKTILSGIDAYKNTSQRAIIEQANFYHATLAFKFNGVKWNTNLNSNASKKEYDLYSYVLREAVHSLGFSSLLSNNGLSKLGANFNYYSRFDTFLKNANNQNLITNNGCNSLTGYSFTGTTTNLHNNCIAPLNFSACTTAVKFAGTSNLELYTPNCYNNENSFNLLNENCNPITNYYLMQSNFGKGTTKRFLSNEERNILNDMGYGFASSYGTISNLSYINYNQNAIGNKVAGVNDGIANNGNYIFIGNTNEPIQITNLLGNDLGNNLQFECLKDVSHTGTTINMTTGSNSNIVEVITSQPGFHVLSYVPYNTQTNQRGAIAYVYLYARANCASTAPMCDLIRNGGFEDNNGLPDATSQLGLNVCQWEEAKPSCDYFHINGSGQGQVPGPIASLLPSSPQGQNAYAGFIFDLVAQNVSNEVPANILQSPLESNTDYQLTFLAAKVNFDFTTDFNFGAPLLEVYLSRDIDPVNYQANLINGRLDLTVDPVGILRNTDIFLTNDNQWVTCTVNFNSGSGGQRFLYIGNINNAQFLATDPFGLQEYQYCAIDNVSLKKVQSFNPTLNIQPVTICSNTSTIINLDAMLTNGVPEGIFTGAGVSFNGTNYEFNPAIAGIGTHTITYTIPSPTACPEVVITDTIEVISCQPPYISQVYAGAGKSKALEVKNASNTQAITPGSYYLVYYEGNGVPANLATPTASIDLAANGAIPANGVKVFRSPAFSAPTYVTTLPNNEIFNVTGYDGLYDVIIISTSNGANAYNDRIDVLGDNTAQNILSKQYTQEDYRSLVRMTCTPMGFPRVDYDEQDWVGFNRFGISTLGTYDDSFELAQGTKTNGELGRHFSDVVEWIGSWNDIGILDPTNESNPDRSRSVVINALYDTSSFGNFEACSLVSNIVLNIAELNNVKVQTKVTSTPPFNGVLVQNQGSLIQVRDSYYTESNQQLIVVNGQNSMKHSRNTIGLNRGTDYVYWSSPLSLNTNNKTAGQIFNFGTATGQFNPSRFYRFENQNFYDMLNTYGDNGSGTDGYDDDLNDYVPFSSIPNAINEHFIPGRGYATWPPISSNGLFTNYPADYLITFEGEMNNGLIEVPVYRNDSQFGTDSNLVGNPYPSPIDLNKFLYDPVNTALIRPVAFIWGRFVDDTPLTTNPGPELLNFIEDNFKIYNPNMVIDPTQAPYSGNEFISNGTLASCQSFFVLAKDPEDNNPIYNTGLIETLGNIRFSNYMRTTEPNNTFSRSSLSNKATNRSNAMSSDKLWVNLTDANGYTVQLGVTFKEDGTATYNQNEDIETVQGRKYNFYTQTTSKDLIIDVQDEFNTSKEIPLGILNNNASSSQIFTISIPRKEGVFNTQSVYLFDEETQTVHNLTNSSFSFTSNQIIIENRFKLVFEPYVFSSTFKQSSNIICSFNQNGLTLTSTTSEIDSYEVFDLEAPRSTGYLIVYEKNANSKSISLPLNSKHKLISVKIKLKDGTQLVKKLAR